jgi:hypothetical protein
MVTTLALTRARLEPTAMGVESLTYIDLADRLGTTPEAARSLVRRLRLPRYAGNDGKVRVNVDLTDIQYKRLPARSPAGHRADFERERDRSDTIMSEALRLTKVAMAARESAARLEGQLASRQQPRSWWKRLAG